MASIHGGPTHPTRASRDWWLVPIVLLAAGLRLYRLGSRSLWYDEVGQAAVAAAESLSALLIGVEMHHGAAPLDYLVTSVVSRLSRSEWALRGPAALWGTLSVYWVARLGRRLAGRPVGRCAALLMAISPLHIEYSQELRFYALFVLLSLLATERFLVAWEAPSRRRWAAYAALLVAGVYTHYYTLLLVAYHASHAAARHLAPRGVAIAQGAVVGFALAVGVMLVAFVPWGWFALWRDVAPGSSIEPPALTWSLAAQTFGALSGGAGFAPLWHVLAALGACGWLRRDPGNAAMPVIWVLTALPLVVLADQVVHYFFSVRQVLFALPPFLLLVAYGIGEGGRLGAAVAGRWNLPAKWRHPGMVSAMLVLSLTVVSVPQVRRYYRSEREDWRGAGQWLERRVRPDDVVILFNAGPYVKFYAPQAARQEWRTLSIRDLDAALASGRPVWALWTHYVYLFPEAIRFRAWLDGHAAQRVDFHPSMSVYLLRPPPG